MAAIFTRTSVIALSAAMALGQMGLADLIINLAFGLILGGIVLATALETAGGAQRLQYSNGGAAP